MNKYFNTIIFAFFAVLISSKEIGYSLFIPILYFMAYKNYRNLILIVPISFISCFIFNKNCIFGLGICYLFLLLYILLIKKKENLILDGMYISLNNIVAFLVMSDVYTKKSIVIYLIATIISAIIYIFFKYNITCVKKNKSNIYSYANIEVICAIISVLGSLKIEYSLNIGLLLAAFYVMYFSSNGNSYHSLFISVLLTFFFIFYLDLKLAICLPFISALYLINGLWSSIILITITFTVWLSNQTYIDDIYLQGLIYTAVFFEICKETIITSKIKQEEIYKDAYSKSMDKLNTEIINFASFLDMYSKDYAVNKDYITKLNDAISQLQGSYCNMCYMKETCFKQNKGVLYKYMTELVLYSKRSDYSTDTFIHLKKCPYFIEMKKRAEGLNLKYGIDGSLVKTNALVGIINGVSNVLRQYTVDNTLKKEMDYNIIYKIRKSINDLGYNISYFNVRKMFIDDFLIEIGIRGFSYSEIENDITNICNNYIPTKVSVNYVSTERGKVYMNIIPKINFNIDFGVANIASSSNGISGDNYLIKDLSDTRYIACISDGMGKGYEANHLSSATLKLVDNISNANITSSTSLQIINTFYSIQDYLEKYSTLDYVEINKIKGTATFFKLGAATSYLYSSSGKCKVIENKSLPFGLEETVEGVDIDLKDGDMIIMASDGMFEATECKEELEVFIKGIAHLSAQSIVYEIINKVKLSKKIDDDDMSIIVMKMNAIS